jgi:predicted Rossmann-fold nucleotide-binding protein
VEDYWRPLIAFARHATEEGFVCEADLASIAVTGNAGALLDRLERLEHAERPRAKWTAPEP